MARKQKSVFTAEPEKMRRVEGLVREGRYRSVSEFLREAIDRRLAEIEAAELAEQIDRYCEAGYADESAEIVDEQAIDGEG